MLRQWMILFQMMCFAIGLGQPAYAFEEFGDFGKEGMDDEARRILEDNERSEYEARNPLKKKKNADDDEKSSLSVEDFSSFFILAKALSDDYLMKNLDDSLKNDLKHHFNKIDASGERDLAYHLSYEVTKELMERVVDQLTHKTYMVALPNFLKGESVLDEFSVGLLTSRIIPYEVIQKKEPYYISEKIGFRFVKLGAKASSSWKNFFKVMALGGAETLTDAVAAGVATVGANEVMMAQMYNINALKKRKNQDFKSFKKVETDFSTDNLLKTIGKNMVKKLMIHSIYKTRDLILPDQQITGFYTVKDGEIYHVHYDHRSQYKGKIETALNRYGYASEDRVRDWLDAGVVEVGKEVVPAHTLQSYAFSTFKAGASFVADEILDFYIGSSLSLVYQGANWASGGRMDRWVFDTQNPSSHWHHMAKIHGKQAKQTLSSMIKNFAVKPAITTMYQALTGNKPKNTGQIAGIGLVDSKFVYLYLTKEYQMRLVGAQ